MVTTNRGIIDFSYENKNICIMDSIVVMTFNFLTLYICLNNEFQMVILSSKFHDTKIKKKPMNKGKLKVDDVTISTYFQI